MVDIQNIKVNWRPGFDIPGKVFFLLVIIPRSLERSWRASVASETLTGVTQFKIGDVCWRARQYYGGSSKIGYILLASERSERDTLRCNAIEISLYLFIYLFIDDRA